MIVMHILSKRAHITDSTQCDLNHTTERAPPGTSYFNFLPCTPLGFLKAL